MLMTSTGGCYYRICKVVRKGEKYEVQENDEEEEKEAAAPYANPRGSHGYEVTATSFYQPRHTMGVGEVGGKMRRRGKYSLLPRRHLPTNSVWLGV